MNLETIKINLNELNKLISQNQGQYSLLKQQYESALAKQSALNYQKDLYLKAVELLTAVQGVTRDKIKSEFETLVSFIMQFVTEKDYQFQLEFNKRGNLQELDFRIKTPNNQDALDMLDSCGGGIIDLVSFALRIVLMETSIPKTKGFILMDEALKHLSSNYMERIPALLEELSKKLNRQFIIISHEQELIDSNFYKIEVK